VEQFLWLSFLRLRDSSIDKSIITCKVRTKYGHISHKRVCVLFVLIEMENFIQNEIMIAYIFRNNINIV
jgi:hypothetical protein